MTATLRDMNDDNQGRGRWSELIALLTANGLSMLGNALTVIAVPYFVYDWTGNAMTTAGVVLAGQLPNLLVGILGGHFIDRYSARSVSLVTDAVNAVSILLIPVLYLYGGLNLALLGVLVFLSQVLDAPGSTARRVLVPELIDQYALPRKRVNGLDSLIETGADLIGPPLAGLLIALIGAIGLLYIDALTFLLSFLIILFGIKSRKVDTAEQPSVRFRETLHWMLRQPTILKLAGYDILLNMVATALLALTLPVLARMTGHESLWLGVWLAFFAIGTSLTTVLYTLFGERVRTLTLLRWTPMGQALGLSLVALSLTLQLPPWLWCLWLMLFGANLGVGSMVDAMVLQQQVPEQQRGRVFAVFTSLRFSGVPLSLLLAGGLLEAGMPVVLLIIMVSLLLAASLMWARNPHASGDILN